MATLLRKFKRANSDISHVQDMFTSTANDNSTTPPVKSKVSNHLSLRSFTQRHFDVPTPVEPEVGAYIRQQAQGQRSPFASLRQRLVRKASTLSLRSKSRRGNFQKLGTQSPHAHTFFAFEDDSDENNKRHHFDESLNPLSDTESAPYPPPIPTRRSSTSIVTQVACNRSSSIYSTDTRPKLEPEPEHIKVHQLQRNLEEQSVHHHHQDHKGGSWAKMASDSAAPPVPYERLRQLTTEACDSTLSTIKSYSHTSTETWNTQIINTILAALVQESTPSSSDDNSPLQPSFKFIVNSTIIQHAAVASNAGDDAIKSAGRRGMHSASGAFWNNERDGMWSFKYEAAEAKGLDVVVGIIWIWVG